MIRLRFDEVVDRGSTDSLKMKSARYHKEGENWTIEASRKKARTE